MTDNQKMIALSRLRRWLATWEPDELARVGADDILPALLVDAARAELEARAVSAVVLP